MSDYRISDSSDTESNSELGSWGSGDQDIIARTDQGREGNVDISDDGNEEVQVPRLPVSIFQPHHAIHCHFPDESLLDDEDTIRYFFRDMDNRYVPRPLIEHEAVIENRGYAYRESYSYVTLSDARPQHGAEFLAANAWIDDVVRLQHDLNALASCNGKTHLYIVLASFEGQRGNADNRRNFEFRVKRVTDLWNPPHERPGDNAEEVAYYEFPYRRLGELRGTELWEHCIKDLINGISDRAVRHRQTYRGLPDNDPDLNEDNWRPRRRPDMALAISLVTDPFSRSEMNDEEADDFCPVCYIPWDEIECPLRRMRECGCTNIFCQDCLIHWSEAYGLASRCPKCRGHLFRDAEVTKSVAFGEDANGNYIYDDRFTEYENIERSYADLDQDKAFQDTTTMIRRRVFNDVVIEAWKDIVRNARRAPKDYGKLDFNPVHFPEFGSVNKGVMLFRINAISSVLSVAALYSGLRAEVFANWIDELQDSHLGYSITAEEIRALRVWIKEGGFIRFRPGFLNYVLRMLNRLVNFMKRRICECEGEQGMHLHGDCREYYSTWKPGRDFGLGKRQYAAYVEDEEDEELPTKRQRLSGERALEMLGLAV